MKHTEFHVSQKKIDFNKTTIIGIDSEGRNSERAHGILMSIAYMVMMPIGRTVARFFKETWSDTTIKKRKVWFVVSSN